MRRLITAVLFLVACASAAVAQALPAPSAWVNQRGSELYISQADAAGFSGTFVNRAAGFECQGQPYRAAGRGTAGSFFFIVTFDRCHTVTRWRGRLAGGVLQTEWALTYVDAQGNFRHLRGLDQFRRRP